MDQMDQTDHKPRQTWVLGFLGLLLLLFPLILEPCVCVLCVCVRLILTITTPVCVYTVYYDILLYTVCARAVCVLRAVSFGSSFLIFSHLLDRHFATLQRQNIVLRVWDARHSLRHSL